MDTDRIAIETVTTLRGEAVSESWEIRLANGRRKVIQRTPGSLSPRQIARMIDFLRNRCREAPRNILGEEDGEFILAALWGIAGTIDAYERAVFADFSSSAHIAALESLLRTFAAAWREHASFEREWL